MSTMTTTSSSISKSSDDLPCLSAPELSADPEAVETGYLYKRGGGKISSGWKHRYFILIKQYLVYYKNDKERTPKGKIYPLRDFKCEEGSSDPNHKRFEFLLIPRNNQGRTYQIYAESESEKSRWMQAIQYAIMGQIKALAAAKRLQKNAYDIPPKDLDWSTSDILGKGASGIVKRGIWLKTTEVAVKALNNLPEFTDSQEIESFYKEIETLSQLRHPNIVPMFGFCNKEGYVCLVTEFVKGGNLSDAIHNPQKRIDIILQIELCCAICRGMVYLHTKNVIHRDLKPGNILVENLEEAKVKVCDFGLSTITKGKNEMERTSNTYGSPAYAAPELPTSGHTNKVDVFSFGVIMWEICTRQRPWLDVTHAWQIAERVNKGDRLQMPRDHPLYDLLQRCWATDPNLRPTFSEIYTELERMKQNLPSRKSVSLSGSSAIPFMVTDPPEIRILDAFRNKASIPWSDFSLALTTVLRTKPSTVESLRFILADQDGNVDRNRWENFVKWFSPLNESSNQDYFTADAPPQSAQPTEGYVIDEIVDIVGQNWFFGFMDANQAKDLLMLMPVGSFLFRFSGTPGWYTLSVNYGQVGHWRITTSKMGTDYPSFRIDEVVYRSLHDIIEKHSKVALVTKTGGPPTSCCLVTPADREKPPSLFPSPQARSNAVAQYSNF